MGTLEEALSSGDWQGASAAGAMKAESNLHHELKDKGAFDNARYGVESQAKKTAKKIKTQGSVDEAVAVDVKEAGQKASQQKGSVEATQKKAEEIAKKKGISASEVLENTAYKLAGGKLASDVASITEGDKYKNGGYEGLMRDSANVKMQQNVGSTKWIMKVANNLEGQQDYINKMLKKADPEKREAMLKDLVASGWTDSNGKVIEGNFLQARSMLSANNMMSVNSMGIGGSIVSGTIGASGACCKEDSLVITFGNICCFDKGNIIFDKDTEHKASLVLQQNSFTINCDLGIGNGKFTAYGCDLGYEYVKINADYRT